MLPDVDHESLSGLHVQTWTFTTLAAIEHSLCSQGQNPLPPRSVIECLLLILSLNSSTNFCFVHAAGRIHRATTLQLSTFWSYRRTARTNPSWRHSKPSLSVLPTFQRCGVVPQDQQSLCHWQFRWRIRRGFRGSCIHPWLSYCTRTRISLDTCNAPTSSIQAENHTRICCHYA